MNICIVVIDSVKLLVVETESETSDIETCISTTGFPIVIVYSVQPLMQYLYFVSVTCWSTCVLL